MTRSIKKRWTLFGALIGTGTTLALVIGLGVFAGAGAAASSSAPKSTSALTIKGTAQEGQKLTGDRGTWSETPTDFNNFWMRCDKTGASCAKISGAVSKSYTLTSADVGNTLRYRVDAKNADGTTSASSVPTAVVIAAEKPAPAPTTPATGCPSGAGSMQVAGVGSPAQLLIDQQQTGTSVVNRGTQQLVVRYHVSACGGRSVQGAMVYATAVPFNQLSIPAEQATNSDGWAELDFRMISGFPASRNQQLIAIFVRARKSGENLLSGISTRRLFSVRVNLNG
jgi:hypothetical protein